MTAISFISKIDVLIAVYVVTDYTCTLEKISRVFFYLLNDKTSLDILPKLVSFFTGKISNG